MPPPALKPESLIPHLQGCGYVENLLAHPYEFGTRSVPVAAFASSLHDLRSACIAVIETGEAPEAEVRAVRPLGAPIVLACQGNSLQWWKQTTGPAELHEGGIAYKNLRRFFTAHKDDFNPARVFEGKTLRRLPDRQQLTFVDAGLMPYVEQEAGTQLSGLIEDTLGDIANALNRKLDKPKDVQNAIKATFWLLAAKVLHDKQVKKFKSLDVTDIEDVFARVGRHYGVSEDIPPSGAKWRAATQRAADRIGGYPSLRNLSTESLAHVYENAMVTREVRKAYGTHSTPSALVDYMVWQLWPWVEKLPPERRHVFEPACGHGAFLLGALRLLRQWSGIEDENERHAYLKKHLHGAELDSFAIEVARLSLTLADVPHPNGWDLRQVDMFEGDTLRNGAAKCGILLGNPPYERFTAKERSRYAKLGSDLQANTKAVEVLYRTVPHLRPGACFGLVVPQGFLHSTEGKALRRELVSQCELREIVVFGDDLFEKSDHEAAAILGRRTARPDRSRTVAFRRVANEGLAGFRDRFAFSSDEVVETSYLSTGNDLDFRVPELSSVWTYLRDNPVLDNYATLGQGLAFKGRTLPVSAWTTRRPRPDDALGFTNVPSNLQIFARPPELGINLKREVLLHVRAGMPTGAPQVVVNYAPVSRGPWRLKAVIDGKGVAVTSRFIAVRQRSAAANVVHLWALLNSPVANAFAHTHLGKRDNLVGMMRRIPVPKWSSRVAARIEQAAMNYRARAKDVGPLWKGASTPEDVKQALLEMDAAVLQAYDLPPRLERQLLDLFEGVGRKGVGCDFTGYYPAGFTSYLPLHHIISQQFEEARADRVMERVRPGKSEYVAEVLEIASEAFGEE